LILIVRIFVGTMPAASLATVTPPVQKLSSKNHQTILKVEVHAF